ncbi:PucR C-terminal helix-turn-helix domain-containing protein [Oceanobacillus limi]|uniref:PucR C-terminal helix-turn-helix domain-containing protein n=1 Tax=Oceanobacillus limi TaxID=930131 RepID=A0A1H9YJR2_9BACI|nr:helix-turn-helix domain-containing protein [Oceanobacillus limi]SES69240.1 PucR C-terminal helix-turn-helix domain-containing protein [Oceanobacillus limi]
MIDQLKKIFPSLITYNTMEHKIDPEYEWYLSEKKELIGILKRELSVKDKQLLHTFLEPYNHNFPVPTEKEKLWQKRIHHHSAKQEDSLNRFRFVYFSIPSNQIDPISFKEAITELFPTDISILWENQQEGIIVEDESNEAISYKQIIDILMSDLYVKIKFLVGPFQADLQSVQKHYQYIIHSARIAFSYTERNVISYVEAIPHLLIDQTSTSTKQDISSIVLKGFADDQELIQTIEVFLESNLNISVAAKKLYMHRNSLQYRLDKFNENTGIDVRDFHQALPVYLALLANQK